MTLAEATALRDEFRAALTAVLGGQSYTIAGRSLTRADAKWISDQFARYQALVENLTAGRGAGVRVQRVVPRDA